MRDINELLYTKGDSRLQKRLPILRKWLTRKIGQVAATLPLSFGNIKTQMNTGEANGECGDTHSPNGQSASAHILERIHVEA